ncbi:GINS complex subunit [Schaereria dolodes]|nr:GINS complex subunit [Schaereria dolodes]
MDIDDILADVAGYGEPRETRDLQELTRAWIIERSAPEILQWPQQLMERVMERIRQQVVCPMLKHEPKPVTHMIDLVETQTGNMDPKTNFCLIIIQTELERYKFLVRSFVRARVAKIDKHALHYLTNPTQKIRLSSSELHYATTHQSLLQAHYHSSFLSQFPTTLQRLDDTAGGISMIEQPDLDKAVFVRALRDVREPIVVEGTDMAFEMRRGDVFIVRWSAVKETVEGGDAELI